MIDNASCLIRAVCDEEIEAVETMPDFLHYTEQFERIEESAQLLSDAEVFIDDAYDDLRKVLENLESAVIHVESSMASS